MGRMRSSMQFAMNSPLLFQTDALQRINRVQHLLRLNDPDCLSPKMDLRIPKSGLDRRTGKIGLILILGWMYMLDKFHNRFNSYVLRS